MGEREGRIDANSFHRGITMHVRNVHSIAMYTLVDVNDGFVSLADWVLRIGIGVWRKNEPTTQSKWNAIAWNIE